MVMFRPDLLYPDGDFTARVLSALQVFRERGNPEFRLPGEIEAERMDKARLDRIEIPDEYSWLFV